MSAIRRHLVDTPEGQVHLRYAGRLDSARGVLLFHQSPSSSRMWAGVMELLAAEGVPSVAVDMLDYGQSDRQVRQLTVDEHAGLLVEAARAVFAGDLTAVGHHTGAVFAAFAAATGRCDSLVAFGYPLYTSWREKFERLGSRIGPDRFSDEGDELATLWRSLNRSIEPDTPFEDRYGILVDRLVAGPLWFTAYAALMAADLEAPLRRCREEGLPVTTAFARDDAISRLASVVEAATGTSPVWIEGGPWVTVEHPDRVVPVILQGAVAS